MIMKQAIKSILVGGTMLAATSAAHAELEAELYTGFHSIYEFRGVELGDDGLIDVGIDLNYDLGSGINLNAGVWYGDSEGSNGGDFEEIDYYIGLSKSFGAIDLSVGYTYYDFAGSGSYSDEYFIGLATEFKNGIGVSLNFYDDFNGRSGGRDTTEGEYLELEGTKSWELSPCVNLDVAVGAAWSFSYNSDVNGGGRDGFNHYYISVATPWSISEKFTLTPYLKFVGADSDLASDFRTGRSEDLFYGGVSLSYSF